MAAQQKVEISTEPIGESIYLRVAICDHEGTVRIVTFDDPRVRFCKTFNEDSDSDGLFAIMLPD